MPNPAISRLSASPTPGNATRYSNVAQCVRETCTRPDFRGITPERLLYFSSRYLPQHATYR